MPRVLFISIFLLFISSPAYSDRMDSYQIGSHGQGNAKFPPWFKESFLDLSEDWSEARQAGKKGIIIFFSQENCSHCQAFLQTTLSDPLTRPRVQKSYDVIGLDIFSDNELKRVNGTETSIKNFAETAKARFTPTLLFYGDEKRPVARIVGFYPPEKFNQVLDYIDGYHYKKEKLSQYLRTMHQNADNVETHQNIRMMSNYLFC